MTARASLPIYIACVAFLGLVSAAALLWGKDTLWAPDVFQALLPIPLLSGLGIAFLKGSSSSYFTRVGWAAVATAAWWAAMLLGTVTSLLVTQWTGPLADDWLSLPERWVGVTQRDALEWALSSGWYGALAMVYGSHLLQVQGTTLYHTVVSPNPQLLWRIACVFAFCSAAAIPLYILLPAEGPTVLYGWEGPMPSFLESFRAMRSESAYQISRMDGYITSPSFHAVFAVTLTRLWWTTPFRLAAIVWNSIMLLATWICGAHYLTDLVMGVALAGAALYAFRELGAPRAATLPVAQPQPTT